MNVSADFKKVPTVTENHKNENTNADVEYKKRVFDRYLITPIKKAVRYIADGACAVCRNIRAVLVAVCSPVSSCFRKKGSSSSREIDEPDPYTSNLDRVSKSAGKPEISRLKSFCGAVAPAPVVVVSAAKTVDPKTESPLVELSSGTNGKSLSFNAMPDVVPADSGGVAGLSMVPSSENVAASETMKKQSVFTASHFAGPAYNKIRQFLLVNPDLRSNFPEEVASGRGVRRQWRDLEFPRARLLVRDVGYCKKRPGSPKKHADKAVFPLVGVDCFRNTSDASDAMIAQCPGSLAHRWMQRKDAPGIFVINFRLHGMNMVLYYAVPEPDLMKESCQPLLKKLVSGNGKDIQDVLGRFKIIPELVYVGGVDDTVAQYASVPAIMSTIFSMNGYHCSNYDTGARADEIHIDLLCRSGLLADGLFNHIAGHLNNEFPELHIRMGFAIEPLAVDEREVWEKALREPIEDQLPERILGGIELSYPEFDDERFPKLQQPFPVGDTFPSGNTTTVYSRGRKKGVQNSVSTRVTG